MSPAVVEVLLLLALSTLASSVIGANKTSTAGPKSGSVSSDDFDDPRCVTPDSKQGLCVAPESCPRIRKIRNERRLRDYYCGYAHPDFLLCCPNDLVQGSAIALYSNKPPPAPPPDERPEWMPEKCGRTRLKTEWIDTRKGIWPWQVLVLKKERQIPFDFRCGGSLISEKHVLSAAHCFAEAGYEDGPFLSANPKWYKVRLGDQNRRTSSSHAVERDVVRLVRHQNYDRKTQKNNIALLFMDREVTFDRYISPICLPYTKDLRVKNLTDESAYVTGWERITYGETAKKLKNASFPIWDDKRCSEAYNKSGMQWFDNSSFICAGEGARWQASCEGDSGGPLVLPVGSPPSSKFYQIGILSVGVGCASEQGRPGLSTRVTNYLVWINDHISKKKKSPYQFEWVVDVAVDLIELWNSINAPSTTQAPKERPKPPKWLPKGCGSLKLMRNPRIREPVVYRWPWHVLVVKKQDIHSNFNCDGSLISRKHVLTAAQCFADIGYEIGPYLGLNPNEYKVRLGPYIRFRKKSHEEERDVIRIISHENWDRSTHKNDIAIVFMDKEVSFSDHITPICLPYELDIETDDVSRENAIVGFYGEDKQEINISDTLKNSYINLMNDTSCSMKYKQEGIRWFDNKSFICTTEGPGWETFCGSNSGGPLALFASPKYYQIGIVSGAGCDMTGLPSLSTRVANYLQWINDRVSDYSN